MIDAGYITASGVAGQRICFNMMALRILHVLPTLAPSYGGPTRVLSELVPVQVESGHQVTVCTTDRDYPAHKHLPESFLKHTFPKPVQVRAFGVEFTPLMISLKMGNWLRHHLIHFDVVHIHGLYRFPCTYAAFQSRWQGIPHVIQPHGSLDPFLYERSTQHVWLKRVYERWFDLPNLNGADALHFTAVEERERTAFLKLRAPSFIVPNGIEWSLYNELPVRGALRSRWNLDDVPLVLFLGRLHLKKGLDLLIPAFDALRRRVPDAQLVIIGPENDDYGQKVRGWVKERDLEACVHFLGTLEGRDVVQAYVDADVFVLPSYTENFGMTVAEAMACGLPVVISDQVNIHADVTHSGAGLVTRCNVDEVTEAMDVLLKDPALRVNMGEAGRSFVQATYTWPRVVEALTREYEQVIARKQSQNLVK
jgi:glycosyltransferase involved in cell wall biosynthesis